MWISPPGSGGLTWVLQAFIETRLNEFPQLSELLPQHPLACGTMERPKKKKRKKGGGDSGGQTKSPRWEKEHVRQMPPSLLVWMWPHHIVQKNKKQCLLLLCSALLCTPNATQRARHSPVERTEGAVCGAEGRKHQGQQQAFLFSVGILHYVIIYYISYSTLQTPFTY